jgi:hypothetical protein
MKVGSIFFDEKDKDAALAAQKPTPVQHPLAAAARIPPTVGTAQTFARTVATGRSSRTEGPALWWHTNECNWFHPGD